MNRIKYPFYLLFILCLIQLGCTNSEINEKQVIKGQTWTKYSITINTTPEKVDEVKATIDSLLKALDQSVSTYIPLSEISEFNRSNKLDTLYVNEKKPLNHFVECFRMSKIVVEETNGYFDPTVMPLVNYYGFGTNKEKKASIDSVIIDSINQYVGFLQQFYFYKINNGYNAVKKSKYVELDFSAIAKGYIVDQVGQMLKQKGFTDYLVEIGGEIRASGLNSNEKPWNIAVEQPIENGVAGENISVIIPLSNLSMATSGNYRNFKIVNGEKVVHTINPKTGFSEVSNLLSATIVTNDCAFADAYATACMVMGYPECINFVESMTNLEGFFIYSNKEGNIETHASEGMKYFK